MVRAVISVFPPKPSGKRGFRIWNSQLIQFAAWEQEGGGSGPTKDVLGDPKSVAFTEVCLQLGWEPNQFKTAFDVLPLILEAPGHPPELFTLPQELLWIVHIEHWKYPRLKQAGLRWTAIPAISDLVLDVGGLIYTAVPFNGWFMETEISRDLLDVQRYNRSEAVANLLQMSDAPKALQLDEVQLIVNQAIMHSFQSRSISIVDHHAASRGFMKFYDHEIKQRGSCPADWVWITPPAGGSMTEVYHQEMINYQLKPYYAVQPNAWLGQVLSPNRMNDILELVRRMFANLSSLSGLKLSPTQVNTFLTALAEEFLTDPEMLVLGPGTKVIASGDSGDDIFLICQGSVSVYVARNAQLACLTKGNWCVQIPHVV